MAIIKENGLCNLSPKHESCALRKGMNLCSFPSTMDE